MSNVFRLALTAQYATQLSLMTSPVRLHRKCAGMTGSRTICRSSRRLNAFSASRVGYFNRCHNRGQRLQPSAAKGFGTSSTDGSKPSVKPSKSKPAVDKDLCPCGSGKKYEVCCEPYHLGSNPPTMEALLRARFSGYAKKKEAFLIKTFHPLYHSQKYLVGPGEAQEKLEIDVHASVDRCSYSDLQIKSIEPVSASEGWIEFSYMHAVLPPPTPAGKEVVVPKWMAKTEVEAAMKPRQQRVAERSRFLLEDGVWLFCNYDEIETPEDVKRQRAEAEALEKKQAGKKQ